jgi:hypothetical protein
VKIAPALVKAQAEIKAMVKDAKNDFFKSKYLTLDSMVDELKPVLAKYELAIVQGSTEPRTDANGMLRTVTLETMVIHSSGEWMSNSVVMPVGTTFDKQGREVGPTPQIGGSSITYGRRYGLGAFFSIVTDEDDDGNAASQRQKKKAIAEGKAATDEEVQKIVELAEVTGTMEVVRPHLKGITEEKARDMIARLTRKLKEMNS